MRPNTTCKYSDKAINSMLKNYRSNKARLEITTAHIRGINTDLEKMRQESEGDHIESYQLAQKIDDMPHGKSVAISKTEECALRLPNRFADLYRELDEAKLEHQQLLGLTRPIETALKGLQTNERFIIEQNVIRSRSMEAACAEFVKRNLGETMSIRTGFGIKRDGLKKLTTIINCTVFAR